MPSLRRGSAGARIDLGGGYHRLWIAAAISTAGDGVFLAALPLLAASLSRDPLPVSLVTFSSWLPWLLFGLISGALVDRWDRRRVMWRVDGCRFALVAILGVAVLAGWATIPLLATIGFLLGSGQSLFDNAAQSLIPALVTRDTHRLERANSQLYGARTVGQHLVGPGGYGAVPVGAVLGGVVGRMFGVRAPFLVGAVVLAATGLLALPVVNASTVRAARMAAGPARPGTGA
jgi:MFS family permease